jgi:hypothetical protein
MGIIQKPMFRQSIRDRRCLDVINFNGEFPIEQRRYE